VTRVGVLLALSLGFAGAARAQSPGRAVNAALEALTGGPAGCWGPVEMKDTTFAYFPGVRFIRRYCNGEHGNPRSGIVALDSDSVLYLFDSEQALNFLVARHPMQALDSTTALQYAPVALELAGVASGHSKVVSGSGFPRAQVVGSPRTGLFEISLVRAEPGYDGRLYFFSRLTMLRNGTLWVVRDSLLTSLPNH
jgi:hypothetical protein